VEAQQEPFLEYAPANDQAFLYFILALSQAYGVGGEVGEQGEIVYIREHNDLPLESMRFG
jgi:hypothetical protein